MKSIDEAINGDDAGLLAMVQERLDDARHKLEWAARQRQQDIGFRTRPTWKPCLAAQEAFARSMVDLASDPSESRFTACRRAWVAQGVAGDAHQRAGSYRYVDSTDEHPIPSDAQRSAAAKVNRAHEHMLEWIARWRSLDTIEGEADAIYALRDSADAWLEALHAEALVWNVQTDGLDPPGGP